MSTAEGNVAQVGNAPAERGVSIRVVAIVEDLDPGSAEDLNRRDVSSEIAGQAGQAITGADAEVVSPKVPIRVDTGAAMRIGAAVPRRIPVIVLRPVNPGVAGRRSLTRRWRRIVLSESGYNENQYGECCETFHAGSPFGVGFRDWSEPNFLLQTSRWCDAG